MINDCLFSHLRGCHGTVCDHGTPAGSSLSLSLSGHSPKSQTGLSWLRNLAGYNTPETQRCRHHLTSSTTCQHNETSRDFLSLGTALPLIHCRHVFNFSHMVASIKKTNYVTHKIPLENVFHSKWFSLKCKLKRPWVSVILAHFVVN